jgi:hypothetical protein
MGVVGCHAVAIVVVVLASGCSDQSQVVDLGELDGLASLDGMMASEAPLLIAMWYSASPLSRK